MRTTYQLVTYGNDEYTKLVNVCKFLGSPIKSTIITDSSLTNKIKVRSIVDLSKYELLYVRLTVTIQDIKEVKDDRPLETYS